MALDFEDRIYQGNTRQMNNSLVTAFLEAIQKGNYFAQLYTYTSFANTWLDMSGLRAYSFWLADYNEKTSYTGPFAMWQYTGSGTIQGVDGPVCLDVAYQDFARIIRDAGLNKPLEPESPEAPEDPCSQQLKDLQQQMAAAKEDMARLRQQLERMKTGLEQLLGDL